MTALFPTPLLLYKQNHGGIEIPTQCMAELESLSLQMDCPEDVAQYIHRVGRTARFTAAGHALLYLTPGEQQMAQQLKVQAPGLLTPSLLFASTIPSSLLQPRQLP